MRTFRLKAETNNSSLSEPDQQMEKTFTIDLWKHVNIETVDDALDEAIKRTHKVATDIEFECLSVTKGGALRLKATYVPEKY